jgi:DNA-directed RNA polymerase specialized sigma24 family protein
VIRTRIPVHEEEASSYASAEDFGRIFDEDLNGLYQLSFLLTEDHKKAEQCFVAGIEDSIHGNLVFKEWARSWAKRAIIQNAIRELRPRPTNSESSPFATVPSHRRQSDPGEHVAAEAVLALKDFERFVFVMSVLENYSLQNCALLLGCSISEVREARGRALQNLAAIRNIAPVVTELSDS